MKDLNHKELIEAPPLVQFVYLASASKMPLGHNMLNEAIRDYPEYFPDEVEHRRKYALIPKEVHDQYHLEMNEISNQMYKDLPPSGGLFGLTNNPQQYKKWSEAFSAIWPIVAAKEKEIHQKHYSKYGI